jgi:hypothetical protein
MLRAGANIYYLAKMAIPRGTSVQDAGAQFQGITTEEFQRKLLAKGDGLVDKLKARGGVLDWLGSAAASPARTYQPWATPLPTG